MDKNLLLQMYVAHLKSKDDFIDRSFALNRFYMAVILILMVSGMFFLKEYDMVVTATISVIGAIFCILWKLNQDSYNTQIKIKYRDILNPLEEELGEFTPLQNEFQAFQQEVNQKGLFIYPRILRFFSVLMLLVFIFMFFYVLVPVALKVV